MDVKLSQDLLIKNPFVSRKEIPVDKGLSNHCSRCN